VSGVCPCKCFTRATNESIEWNELCQYEFFIWPCCGCAEYKVFVCPSLYMTFITWYDPSADEANLGYILFWGKDEEPVTFSFVNCENYEMLVKLSKVRDYWKIIVITTPFTSLYLIINDKEICGFVFPNVYFLEDFVNGLPAVSLMVCYLRATKHQHFRLKMCLSVHLYDLNTCDYVQSLLLYRVRCPCLFWCFIIYY
jgi:hypothetical protein